MRVSIVIPAYNAAGTIALCLEGCLRQTHEDREIIVVDDGSTDRTGAIVQGYEGVRYVRQENAGPAAARNRGAAEATGEAVAFTDSDCVPEPGWIAELVKRFDEGVGAVGGTYGIANPEYLLARLVHQEIRMRHTRFGSEVDFLGSFNVAYRAEVYASVGGFDESFKAASGEDNDLAYRIQDAGYRLCFSPDAVVNHFHPVALESYLRTQMRHGYWRMKLYTKHPGRARSGDQYAGPMALLGPPLAVALLGLFVLAFGTAWFLPMAWFAVANAAFAVAYVAFFALHLPLALKVCGLSRPWETAYFVLMSTCRDFARGLGLLRGAWQFQLAGGRG